MTNLTILTAKRKFLRTNVTTEFNKYQNNIPTSQAEIQRLRAKFEKLGKDLDLLDTEILDQKFTEESDYSVLEQEFTVCQEYQTKCQDILAALNSPDISNVPSNLNTLPIREESRSLLRRATAPLPTFSSKEGEDLAAFFSQLENTLSQHPYSDYDKLLILRQQISGRALVLIESLEPDEESYSRAKALLMNALASPEIQKAKLIKKLAELKPTSDFDPYSYIGEMRTLIYKTKKLDLSVEDFLQYFLWNGLNHKFQSILISITNNSRPTLEEMSDTNMFQTADRYTLNEKKFMDIRKRETKITSSYAVNFPIIKCILCSKNHTDASHPIYKCQNFPDPKSKLAELQKLHICIKCANDHPTSECRFSFRTACKKCNQYHFSYLCTENYPRNDSGNDNYKTHKNSNHSKHNHGQKGKQSKNNQTRVISHSSLATINESALQACIPNETILPTFTAYTNGKELRILKDGGCQSNLVSFETAKLYNFKIIKEKINLTVNGINKRQNHHSQVVEIPLKIGNHEYLIEALCLPTISISLELPGLPRIVQDVLDKGYKLADKRLTRFSSEISDIDLILGTKSAFCLPETDVLFGEQSLYAKTSIGIVLKGDCEQILRDLTHMPPNPEMEASSKFTQSLNTHAFNMTTLAEENNHGEEISEVEEESVECNLSYEVLDDRGEINENELDKATRNILENQCIKYTSLEINEYKEESSEINDTLIHFALQHLERDGTGRLVMPLFWDSQTSHLLGKNKYLAEKVLFSNLKKLKKKPAHLELMEQAIKDQEKEGIIERIENIEDFLKEHPEASFLPHMGVFKLDRETTKCRVVFLSNLCEKSHDKMTISHNQAILPGPNLNHKLASSLIQLRFNKYLVCFDLKKAFNSIGLSEIDQNRLLFLWFRNPSKGDFSIVGYKNVRLCFGIRCAPTLLMLALFYMLVLNVENDENSVKDLKKNIYQMSYMDNCALSYNTEEEALWAYKQLPSIFQPYHFGLQQFITNSPKVNELILDLESETPTPSVKLLGLQWDTHRDVIYTKPIQLDLTANSKRKILSSIASQFDLFSFNGPILNRSRLFLHSLQCNKELDWDQTLSEDHMREWRNIVKQVNASPVFEIERFIGKRDDKYRLITFADSSKDIFGAVNFIQCISDKKVSFISAKNRLVNAQLKRKSIPTLELLSATLATECILELYNELCGDHCINPIQIESLHIYSDSVVTLSWLDSYLCKREKLQKRSVFVQNRLQRISHLCEQKPITYSFVAGLENPADCISRCLSPKQLMKSNYFTGPNFLKSEESDINFHSLQITIPTPALSSNTISNKQTNCFLNINQESNNQYLKDLERYSQFSKIVKKYQYVFAFINKLKIKLKEKNSTPFDSGRAQIHSNEYEKSVKYLLRLDQRIEYPEVFEFFTNNGKKKEIPNIVGQLNVYVDPEGLLRVRSKLDRMKDNSFYKFPLLLSKKSKLTNLIIQHYHEKTSHAGVYTLLSELRKTYWIPSYYSTVKKLVRKCITCRRFNELPIKINQSPYREFRANPPNIPFNYIFIDFYGPFHVKEQEERKKVYVLCITCMWSRAVNLKVCVNMSTDEFLRAIQLHCYQFGVPQYCISDLGTQIVAGGNVIKDFLKDAETKNYFDEKGINTITFDHFDKGRSELGSMVETLVKVTKRLLYGSIKKNVLSLRQFEFFIEQTIHLANRRPVAFKETLRDSQNVPEAITPEILIHGHELVSFNILPDLQEPPKTQNLSTAPVKFIKDSYNSLQNVLKTLKEKYHSEFIYTLIKQAVDKKDRYKVVPHKALTVGDIVLIKDNFSKPANYPMGIVKEVSKNIKGEVTGATLFKGGTREQIKRHVSQLILLLSPSQETVEDIKYLGKESVLEGNQCQDSSVQTDHVHVPIEQSPCGVLGQRPKRHAALKGRDNIKKFLGIK